MREKIIPFFRNIYYLKDKIAFFPSIIALAGCFFAYLMMYLETQGISKYLLDFLPELVINDIDSARIILSTFIAGLISIMVFSFSMVMILLNQASSNFSPRLLPGLISNRRHQIVLGIYIATIIYCIFILVFIEPSGKEYQVPGFAVLLSIVFVMVCLGAFIYFIHSISQEIQISTIMNSIFRTSESQLEKTLKIEQNRSNTFPETEKWISYKAKKSGYLQSVSFKILKNIALENNVEIAVTSKLGAYCYKNSELFKVSSDVNEKNINKLFTAFTISFEELISENFNLGFKHLTEIAVKAMSPGINDPGTAIYALDYLTELFILRIQKEDFDLVFEDEKPLVLLNLISFQEIISSVMVSLRTYCKQDFLVTKKIISLLKTLFEVTNSDEKKEIIKIEVDKILLDSEIAISNKSDFEALKKYIELTF